MLVTLVLAMNDWTVGWIKDDQRQLFPRPTLFKDDRATLYAYLYNTASY